MATVRRALIGIVGLLLILDAGALAFLKFGGGPKVPSDEKTKVVLWIDDASVAKTVVAEIKELGYEPVVSKDQRATEVESGFRLTMAGPNRDFLNSIAQTLRDTGHSGLSISEDGTELYYGKAYEQRAQAERVAARIKQTDKMVFEVKAGRKKVKKPTTKIVLPEVPSNMVSDLMSPFSDKIDDSLETPVPKKRSE